MHPNAALIENFYSAFQHRDHETMARSYSDSASFGDPVFRSLDAEQVRAMWRMFCTSGNQIEVTYRDVVADDTRGSARWEAEYRLPASGRKVHNRIRASFTFVDGLIERHEDGFNLYRWTTMALGPLGLLLGWTPLVQNRVRLQAAAQLETFRARERGS